MTSRHNHSRPGGPLPKGAGAVRCPECGAEARADGKGSPIVLRHVAGCREEMTHCGICNRRMTRRDLTDHSHGLDGPWEIV